MGAVNLTQMTFPASSNNQSNETSFGFPRRTSDAKGWIPLILIVEDDRTTGRLMEMLLGNAGFRTILAIDAVQAWKAIRQNRLDMVLLDITFPGGNGFDLCREMQTEASMGQTPVLFISADQDIASKLRGFEAGGVDYIPKPFSGPEVLARITTHLKLKQAYESIARLQAERIERLAGAQELLMPQASDLPLAKFQVGIQQITSAGGDFYDVIQTGEYTHDYIVADASGHDLAASVWTAALKTLLGEYAGPASSPQTVLHSINNAMARILPMGTYFTAIYARLNRKVGKITLTNAGHPPAIICRQNDLLPFIVEQTGDVIGAFADAIFETVEHKVREGDRIILYSDGLVELGGCNRTDGINRLGTICANARSLPIADLISSSINQITSEFPLTDDAVLMAIEA